MNRLCLFVLTFLLSITILVTGSSESRSGLINHVDIDGPMSNEGDLQASTQKGMERFSKSKINFSLF